MGKWTAEDTDKALQYVMMMPFVSEAKCFGKTFSLAFIKNWSFSKFQACESLWPLTDIIIQVEGFSLPKSCDHALWLIGYHNKPQQSTVCFSTLPQ